MTLSSRRISALAWAALALAGAVPARSAGLESAHNDAGSAFRKAPELPPGLRFVARDEPAPGGPARAEGVDGVKIGAPNPGGPRAQAQTRHIKDIDLAAIDNKLLKTSLQYTLGGKTVWVSGVFDRGTWNEAERRFVDPQPYVSILEDGKAARFYKVADVLQRSVAVELGNAQYKLSLSADIEDNLNSEIRLTNQANRREQTRITLREMFDEVAAVGEEVTVHGKAYKVFYFNDSTGGTAHATNKNAVFIHTDAQGKIDVFVIPAERIPADAIGTFVMVADKVVGLKRDAGKLKVYEVTLP